MTKYIVVQVGQFLDERGTRCYQIYKLDERTSCYRLTTEVQNDPVGLKKAKKRLKELING